MRVSKLQSLLSVSTQRWGNGHTRGGGGKVVVMRLKLLKSFRKDAQQQGVPSQLIRGTERLGARGDCGCRSQNQKQKHRTLCMLELEGKAQDHWVCTLQGRGQSSP